MLFRSPSTSTSTSTSTSKNTSNKKRNKEIIYTSEFETFWKSYGAVGVKSKAAEIFNGIKPELYPAIYAGLDKYQAYARANPWYSPQHATTWLNTKGWESEWQYQETNNKPTGVNNGNNQPNQPSKTERLYRAAGVLENKHGSAEPIDITPS